MEADESGLELLITVVVVAPGDREAREACDGLVHRVGGRVAASGDCSDEEPGCWSVTIRRDGDESTRHHAPAALSRQVRTFLRELGPEYTGHPVACEPPTAWTVLDHPETVASLVEGGERVLVEAWLADALDTAPETEPLTATSGPPDEPPRQGTVAAADTGGEQPGGLGTGSASSPRLGLVVDVVTERASGAEWPARALAGRLSRGATVTARSEQPPMVRVSLDLGVVDGDPREVLSSAAGRLGGDGWTRPQVSGSDVVMRWSAAPTPDSGIAAVHLMASAPAEQPAGQTAPGR